MRTADQSIKELKEEARKMSTLMTDVVLGVISPKVCNAACRASAKRVKEIATKDYKARQRGSRYLVSIPKPGAVPPGMVVVHNHIRPRRHLGWQGFRAWLQSPDDPPALVVCPCRWAPELGGHYRVKRSGLEKCHGSVPYVSPEELIECRKDPAWEARHDMIDRIVCRECGALLKSSNSGMAKKHTGHLWRRHRMTFKEYKLTHPGAPLYTLQLNAIRSQSKVKDLITKRVNAFLTPDELAACRKNPTWEQDHGLDVVVCRVCGAKLKKILCGGGYHLTQHGMGLKEYRAEYPNAPWRTAGTTARHRQGMIETRARRTAKLAAADRILAANWRPEDWDQRPQWHALGDKLLSC